MNESKNNRLIGKLCMTAVMAALVAVGSWLQIQIPSILGTSRFHLGNVMCALSGLLLGPWWGALGSGLGSALYDLLLDPTRFAEFPITFVTKGVYGLVAGLVLYDVFVRLLKKERDSYVPQLVSAICAAVGYLIIYSIKTFFYNGMLINGFTTAAQCWALVVAKLPATVVNGALAAIFAPILGMALHKALKAAHLDRMTAAGG